jgi:hypothetical protein
MAVRNLVAHGPVSKLSDETVATEPLEVLTEAVACMIPPPRVASVPPLTL